MGAEIGMLIVETIAKIRRAYFVHGQPIKATCRDLGVSRKVLRKVIRSEATEFRYEREAQPLPRIGPWNDKLDQLLVANEGKASRERLTLIRLSPADLPRPANAVPRRQFTTPGTRSALILDAGSPPVRDAPFNRPQINQAENSGVSFQTDSLPLLG
jgi:hypothetical protein